MSKGKQVLTTNNFVHMKNYNFLNYVLLEQLNPVCPVVYVDDLRPSPRVEVANDDDGEEGAEHDHRLEDVGPHHGLDAALQFPERGIQNTKDFQFFCKNPQNNY